MRGTPEYRAWQNMKARCYNKKRHQYYLWGGRGIKVCDEWLNDFTAFYKHIGKRPSPKHSLDRIDNNKDYEPGNVRWETANNQNANRRRSINESGYVGVYRNYKKWNATINHDGLLYFLGYFEDPEQAALEYDCAAVQLRGFIGNFNYLKDNQLTSLKGERGKS